MRRIKSHLTYANLAATLALLIAIAGGTTAIAGSKAPKNSVASSSIKPFNVTARDLAGIRVAKVLGQSQAFAPCAPRERVIGGGGAVVGPGALGISSPENNGWLAQQGGADITRSVAAYALCLKAKPGK